MHPAFTRDAFAFYSDGPGDNSGNEDSNVREDGVSMFEVMLNHQATRRKNEIVNGHTIPDLGSFAI